MSLKFYNVEEDYINYLRRFDTKVPILKYEKPGEKDKIVCGIVLTINEFNYFAPISSFNQQQATNLVIKDEGRPISSVRFCFMFPAPHEVIKLKDFSLEDQNYQNLLNKEIRFCNDNIDRIHKLAQRIYTIGLNREHKLSKDICDFSLLEMKCKEYLANLQTPQVAVGHESVQDQIHIETSRMKPE